MKTLPTSPSDQLLIADDVWPSAVDLDRALDQLVNTPAIANPAANRPEPDHQDNRHGDEETHPSTEALVQTAHRLMALQSAQPDAGFAADLRRSLFQAPAERPTAPPDQAPAAPPHGLQIVPYRPSRPRYWQPTRVAAFITLALILISSVIGLDSLTSRFADITDLRDQSQTAADVPIFRNDPAGAAAQPGPGPTGPASIAWQFRTGASLTGNPVIANGIIYVGAFNQRLYAIDAATGTEVWSFDAGGTVRGPAVANGVVYIVTGANDLIAVDAASGTERWRVDLKEGHVRPPTVVDGTVYLSSGIMASNNPAVADGTVYTGGGPSDSDGGPGSSVLYAIDANTGQERWRFPTGDHLALYAIDTATGQLRWRYMVEWSSWGAPVVSNGVVVIDTGYYNVPLIAIDTGSGQELWRYDASGGQGPVIVDGVLYAANVALDLKTGRELWRNASIDPVAAAPAIVGNTAYLMTERGTLYAVDANSGAERWHTVIGLHIVYALSPIVTGGTIYVATSDGALYALNDQSSDTHVAALPRDVPNPDDCVAAPVDPATVADVHPTEPQPFVWPLGSPADDATVAEVSTAYRDLVACLNAGDPRRIYPLYTSRYWQVSASRGGTPPDVFLAGEAAPLGVDQQVAIRSISDAEILPDGRIGVRTVTDSRGDLPPRAVTSYLIFAQVDNRWLVDEVVPISESSEIPPVSMPALDPASPSADQPVSPSAAQPVPSCNVQAHDPATLAAIPNADNDSQSTAGLTSTPIPAGLGTYPGADASNAVRMTLDVYIACLNAGERERSLALVSPDFVSRVLEGRFDWSPEAGSVPVTPVPEHEQIVVRSYDVVRLLPDGRVVWEIAMGVKGAPGARPVPTQYVFVNHGGRWLIDDIIAAAPASDAPPLRRSQPRQMSTCAHLPHSPQRCSRLRLLDHRCISPDQAFPSMASSGYRSKGMSTTAPSSSPPPTSPPTVPVYQVSLSPPTRASTPLIRTSAR